MTIPCGLRWPKLHTGEAAIGLSAGIVPSRLKRNTFPDREAVLCALAATDASPVVMYNLGMASLLIIRREPLWIPAAGILSISVLTVEMLPDSNFIWMSFSR